MSGPVVHCITNSVTATRVADALAALGAEPILASAPDEIAEVTGRAAALLLNCGTPSRDRFAAMRIAGEEARARRLPVVLDPVGCGASEWRTRSIRELVPVATPHVIRGNGAELASLAAIDDGPALRGVRSAEAGAEALGRIARKASDALGAVVLATGRGTDVAADGATVHELRVDADVLGRVVGGGDVLSALVAVFLARGDAPLAATLGAHAAFAAAAVEGCRAGPGTFWPAFIDALATRG
jgi:hydroxyethylthiazole kinase